jgi:hypothetical protein
MKNQSNVLVKESHWTHLIWDSHWNILNNGTIINNSNMWLLCVDKNVGYTYFRESETNWNKYSDKSFCSMLFALQTHQ